MFVNQRLYLHVVSPPSTACRYEQGWFTTPGVETLWPIWRTKGESSALDPEVLRDICLAEKETQKVLESEGLCGGCSGGCLPPLSLVSFARIQVQDFTLAQSCEELAISWSEVRSRSEADLVACVTSLRSNFTQGSDFPSVCPFGFAPHMIDSSFAVEGNSILRTTSSVFATGYHGNVEAQALYNVVDDLDRAVESDLVQGTYDTRQGDFNDFEFWQAIQQDMALAFAAGVVTTLAMLIHTKSVWLTCIGLVQIALSFPLAYFFYRMAFGIVFFPFLNFLGIYVVLALGADDVRQPTNCGFVCLTDAFISSPGVCCC